MGGVYRDFHRLGQMPHHLGDSFQALPFDEAIQGFQIHGHGGEVLANPIVKQLPHPFLNICTLIAAGYEFFTQRVILARQSIEFCCRRLRFLLPRELPGRRRLVARHEVLITLPAAEPKQKRPSPDWEPFPALRQNEDLESIIYVYMKTLD